MDRQKECTFCNNKEGYLKGLTLTPVSIESVNIFGTEKPLCQDCNKKYQLELARKYTFPKNVRYDKGLFFLRKFLKLVKQ